MNSQGTTCIKYILNKIQTVPKHPIPPFKNPNKRFHKNFNHTVNPTIQLNKHNQFHTKNPQLLVHMSNSGRIRSRKDRFYSPPALRKYNQQQQQQKQQQQKQQQPKHQEKKKQTETLMTNLDRFINHTTPVVTAQHFPKTSMKGWRKVEEDYHPYFLLCDLWESFKEWSAYGVGVPLVLNDRDSVVQYYAPSLSAIQIYVDPAVPSTSVRRAGEDSDCESSSCDGSSYEAGGPSPAAIKDSDEGAEIRNPPGLLVLEYFERAPPFQREPLASKISDLEFKFPELNKYRSCDLTQSSWLSVAWYPIYRIPVGPSLQNVDTSFLTFHSLSTPLRSTDKNGVHPLGSTVREVHEAQMPCQLSLQIFGLAAYKFKNADWTKDGVHGMEKVNSLIKSTENWLRNLDVHHPDYMFFKNH